MINEWFPWLDSSKLAKITQFREILLKFNDSINLISPNTIKSVDNVHFADSILAATFVLERLGSEPVYDLGSGNGFPGLVMGIINPDRKIILLDRDQKKIEFLKYAVGEIKLNNVSCVVRNLGQDRDLVLNQTVSRAMAPMGRFLKTIKDHCGENNKCYLMKTPKWESELATDYSHLEKMWTWKVAHEYSLPADDQKRVVLELTKN